MPREVIEYRIVCMYPEGPTTLAWSRDRDFTLERLKVIRADASGAEIRLERRTVTYGEPERVEGADAV